ncbi:hypothetical protein K443DRAFT_259258 [Laccaria amethystina LaAM-08-1]|uniref:Uncharacterized protein n=1 Tax=Laccaria amethystina LaAM-08-1 TaxID=1095629 RepID=A0A0C9WWW8_9AGAR|nr:hypothetical protein K443DRAFT_259258 [Laccaria amethystina LaAM-08-1]
MEVFHVQSDKHPARKKKRVASCRVSCSPGGIELVGYSMSLWRLCHDKHPNKVITVTGDDQPTIFTVSHSPSSTYTSPRSLTFFISPC